MTTSESDALLSASETFASALDAARQAARRLGPREALGLAERAQALAQSDAERAEVLALIGRCHGGLGDFQSAEKAFNQALTLAAAAPETMAYVKLQFGSVRSQQGQLEAAKQLLRQAAIGLKNGNQTFRAIALSNLGTALLWRGEYQEAIATLQLAVEIGETLNDWFGVVMRLNNLGECYQDIGLLDEAIVVHTRALTVARERQFEPRAQIDLLRNLAVEYSMKGAWGDADAHMRAALALVPQVGIHDLEMQVELSLAEMQLTRGALVEAEAIGQKLIGLMAGEPTHLASTRLLLGRCALARGDQLQAIALLEAGVLDAEASFSKPLILRLHGALSHVTVLPAIADIHRRIAQEIVHQITDALEDKRLRQVFLESPLARVVAG